MLKFPKTDGLFVRDADNPQRVTTEHRHPVYSQIAHWWVEEKLDGTNCRIVLHPGEPKRCDVRGRSDAATLSKPLREALELAVFQAHTTDEWRELHETAEGQGAAICIYGEGIGLGIQGNPYGLDECRFVGFDIKYGLHPERGWAPPASVHETLAGLGLPRAPIISNDASLGFAIGAGRSGWTTQLTLPGTNCEALAEGVVAKTRVPLYDSRGRLIRLKLKPANTPTVLRPQPQPEATANPVDAAGLAVWKELLP